MIDKALRKAYATVPRPMKKARADAMALLAVYIITRNPAKKRATETWMRVTIEATACSILKRSTPRDKMA